jgi:hypothetical protein
VGGTALASVATGLASSVIVSSLPSDRDCRCRPIAAAPSYRATAILGIADERDVRWGVLLRLFDMRHIFGLCGDITRDVRSAAYMADGYTGSAASRMCEGPKAAEL